MAIDGTKIPAGTLAPYEIMTSKTRMTVARKSEFTIVHWAEVLSPTFMADVSGERDE